jgi:hypothetical protein
MTGSITHNRSRAIPDSVNRRVQVMLVLQVTRPQCHIFACDGRIGLTKNKLKRESITLPIGNTKSPGVKCFRWVKLTYCRYEVFLSDSSRQRIFRFRCFDSLKRVVLTNPKFF